MSGPYLRLAFTFCTLATCLFVIRPDKLLGLLVHFAAELSLLSIPLLFKVFEVLSLFETLLMLQTPLKHSAIQNIEVRRDAREVSMLNSFNSVLVELFLH